MAICWFGHLAWHTLPTLPTQRRKLKTGSRENDDSPRLPASSLQPLLSHNIYTSLFIPWQISAQKWKEKLKCGKGNSNGNGNGNGELSLPRWQRVHSPVPNTHSYTHPSTLMSPFSGRYAAAVVNFNAKLVYKHTHNRHKRRRGVGGKRHCHFLLKRLRDSTAHQVSRPISHHHPKKQPSFYHP